MPLSPGWVCFNFNISAESLLKYWPKTPRMIHRHKELGVRFAKFTGTTSVNGNFSVVPNANKSVIILSAWCSYYDTIVTFFPSGDASIVGKVTWWLHFTGTEANPIAKVNQQLTAYIMYWDP